MPTEKGGFLYRGVAGDKHSEGSAVGEALDALKALLPEDAPSVVVVQSLLPANRPSTLAANPRG